METAQPERTESPQDTPNRPTEGNEAPPTPPNAPEGAQLGLTMDGLLERVRLAAPAVADEYMAARTEVAAAAHLLERSVSERDEAMALKCALVLCQQLPRVAVRFARASKALEAAYESATAPVVVLGAASDDIAAELAEARAAGAMVLEVVK